MPRFDESCCSIQQPPDLSPLPVVKIQLREFVWKIARLYRDVPFHIFEHASHVIMSAGKLMKRIIKTEEPEGANVAWPKIVDSKDISQFRRVHDCTYGISSDPLVQFAIVFSALIHDVDHTGLTNAELVDSKTDIAKAYDNKSVSEQNSVDIAWKLLMDEDYSELRSCIGPSTGSECCFGD
jgi:hypothetical protein